MIEPKTYVINSNNTITITGNWDVNILKSVQFRFTYTQNSLFAALPSDTLSGAISENKITIKSPVKLNSESISGISVDITFNGINYHSLKFNSTIRMKKN